MNKHKRGFTLIELLVVIATILALVGLLVIVIALVSNRNVDHKEIAEESARAWSKSMNIRPVGISCVSRDSNWNGYVSCTINDGTKIHAIECEADGAGCRVQANVLP